MHKSSKKLSLRKETFRTLTTEKLEQVGGAATIGGGCTPTGPIVCITGLCFTKHGGCISNIVC